ncbi:hypothetical protein PSYMO_32042 [Pseudomonas amygdali pv. mori str. 301020]|uniref:Uncharacterized protein n=1 Tax=Pseudomonas amygdali pv. mori str. 301020 TaxID=629261 RepID=A0A656GJJ5_PSEA0|nr:hypothetical protein PSYMO_32042 [Pseudomonas amygdali pv. mori str. 301020]
MHQIAAGDRVVFLEVIKEAGQRYQFAFLTPAHRLDA